MDLPYYVRFFTAVDSKEHGFDFSTPEEQKAFADFVEEYVNCEQFPETGENLQQPPESAEPRYSLLKGEFNGQRCWHVMDGDVSREQWANEDQARIRVAWLNNPERDLSPGGDELTDWEYDELIPF